jgi:hypothetical protein
VVKKAGGKHSCPKEGKELEQLFYKKMSLRKTDSTGTIRRYKVQF